jgi:hypothetical protein
MRPFVLNAAGEAVLNQALDPNSPVGKPTEPSRAAQEVTVEELRRRRRASA